MAGPAARVPFIGLTGGLGAGKSTALAALADLGAATLSTDEVVHDLLNGAELRDEVVATGITVRAPGDTTAVGRRSRAVTADAEAAARLATDDLVGWLRHRRTDGWSRTRLGTAVGHSAQWVRWRLEG